MNSDVRPFGELIKKVLFGIRDYNLTLLIYTVGIGFLSLATPITVQTVVNTFSLSSDLQPLFNLSLILFSLLIVFGILKAFQYITVELMQQKMVAQLSASVSKRVILGPRHSFELHNIREKSNRFFEIITIQKVVASLVTDGLSIVIQTVIGLLLLSFYHPWFIPFNIVVGGIIVGVIWFCNVEAKKSSIRESSAKFKIAGFLQEVASTEARLQNESISLKLMNRADSLIADYVVERQGHFRVLMSETIIFLALYAIVNAGLVGIGGYLIVIGQLSVGQLVAAEIIINGISIQLAYSMKHLQLIYDLYASCDKLSWLLDLNEVDIKDKSTIKDRLILDKSIDFKIDNLVIGESEVLNLNIAPESHYEIKYKDIKSKDLLSSYLLKNKEFNQGDIKVQGVSYKDLSSLEIRNIVHKVDDSTIFDGTIRQNLLDFTFEEKDTDLYEVLKKFDLEDKIYSFENKLNQNIHFSTNLLNASEKYRLNLARVYLFKPKMLMINMECQLISENDFYRYLAEFKNTGCSTICYTFDSSIVSSFEVKKTV